jgi:hypothetical protein
MSQAAYLAKVNDSVVNTKARMLAVRNESVQDLVEIMQTPRGAGGNMRVDTGFLRASLRAAIGSANFAVTDRPDDEAKYIFDMSAITLVIVDAEINDPIEAVYTARYARPREYGARGHPGDRFVALAAQQWQQAVEANVVKLKAKVGG